jgi:structure-specific endonuclease subunit SLX1
MMEKLWFFYIIKNGGFTYAGVSPDPIRRLRQHNGEIKGGAKYPLSKGSGWEHACIISGFETKIQSMQFEWAVKHAPPKNRGGIDSRFKKIEEVMQRERWTKNSPLSSTIPLTVEFL